MFSMYNNDGDPISYIEQMAKAYNAGQKGTVTPEEWEQVTKPSLVATGGANTEQIQAAYIAGQADAQSKLAKPAETVQNESESVEEAKADLKKAIRVPIEGKNEEALAYGAENGDLSMDSVKITGNVPGFTDQQRFSLVEQIIEGAQTKAEKITADVPEDGTFTIPNTPENVARVLDKLKVKAIQEATITKDIDNWMRVAQRAYVATVDGSSYLTDGILVRKIASDAAEFSKSIDGYSAQSNDKLGEFIRDVSQDVLASGKQITSQPVIGKYGKKPVYVFNTENGRAVFDKRYFDRLPKADAIYYKRVKRNRQPMDIVVSYDNNGAVSGLLLGINPKKAGNIDEETFRPASIKNVNAPAPQKRSDLQNGGVNNEQKPERTENGREDIRGGNTGRAGVSKTGEAPAEGRSVSAGGAGGENGLRPNGGNDEGAGARGGRSDASGGLQSGSDAGNAGQKAERAVSEQEHGERPGAGRSSANAVKPKANNKHNHRITEDIDSTRPSFSDNIAAIKLLKTIMNEGRTATPEERAILARYKGWGGIKDILLEHTYHANELKRYVTDEEYEAAKLSVLNAHYTSTKVISAMYDAVKRLGFTGGRVLEPSMGVGNFFGMMPEKLARASELYGVELDTITGNIAKLLYPDAKIDVAGFQDVLYPDGTFDLVIGNVPFSNDIKIPYRNTTFNLHDFFFIKTLDETRPGGIVALITSTGTLDKISGKTQRAISDRANLIAAFRLPDTTFETNAGTEVTTDLIFLQKKGNGIEDNGVAFEKIGKIGNIPINEYYVEHPKNILGKLAVEKNMYGSDRVVVHGGSAAETQALLEKALKTLPRDIMNADAAKASNPVTVKRKGERARSTFTINADGTASITNEKTGEVTVFDPKTKAEKKKAIIIKGYVEIKRTFDSLIDAEKSGNIEGANEYRKRLNEQYDRFRNEYGTLSNDNKRLLSADDDFIRITGLEIQKNDSVEKSPIFDRPTVSRARRTSAGSSDEALSIVLNEDGRVDIDRIAKLTGKSKDEVLADLAGEVVYTPDGDYVLRAQYVSGNIYEKLAQVEGRPEFAEQKKMLEAALPRPRGVGEVNATLGAHWIDPKYISEFIKNTFQIYRYIQEKSFDSYMWQMIERKAAYTAQALNGGDATDLEEVGDIELKAREAKGIATGNPLIVEKMTLQDKADKLGAIYRNWQKEQYEARAIIDNHPRVIEQIKGDIENVEHDLETIRKNTPADFSIKIGNATYDNRADAAKALAAKEKTANVGKVIGNYRGLDVVLGEPSFGDAGKQVFGFTIRGDYAYSGKFGDSEAGNISRVVNMVNDGIEKEKTILKTRIGNLQKELAEAKETVKRPFAQQEEYDQVKARQLEVDQELGIIENEAQVENETAENASGDVDQSRGATMPRPQDWTAKRIKDGKATEARPLSELIAKMEHDFGLNVTFGHVRGSGVRGTFNHRDKGLRSKLENDLPAISHELGHWLDDRFGITETDLPDAVKEEFKDALGLGKAEYPQKKWVTEGLAEFVRQYLKNRDTASIDFEAATKYFLGMMDAKSLALFQNFADEINAVYALDADTAASSVVSKEKGTPDFRTPAEKAQDAYNRFRMDYIDTNDPIRRLDRITGGNAYIYATNAAHSSAIAERLLKSDLVDLDGQYVGPGLKSALQGVNTHSKKEWQDFNEYLVMLHGPERLAAGKRVFANDAKNNAAFMDRRRAALEKQYPAFRGAAARLIRFENELVYTWGVKTGLISEDLFRTWKKIYKHHVPLNRVIAKGSFSTKQKRGFANQSSPLRRAKGSGLDIYYPVENIMDEVAMLVHAGLHNNVYRIVCDEATSNNLEAIFMEKIATPMKPHKFNVSGLKTQIKNEVYEGTMRGEISDKSAESINKVLENIADVMTQYERGKAGGDIVTVMRDGTPEFWKVNDPLLLEALTNMTAPKISGVMKFFAVTTRFIQSKITGSDVIWGIFSNAPRDIMTLMHYTQFKDRPVQLLKAIGSTYVNAFREMYLDGRNVDPLYLEFLSLGGKHTGKHTADSDFYMSARRSFTQTNTQRVLNAINPINAVGFVSDTIEMGPRFATYKLLRQQGVSQQKAFYEAMDITVNFYKGGRVSRDISKFIPYFNANVQGTDKFARYYTAEDAAGKENRTRVIRSRVLGLLASGLILGALEYIINNADDEKKKDYQQLSNYTKNSYFNIPTGDGKYFSIPKGRELDVWTSMVERAMETWIGDNKHAFDEFYEYAVDNFLPPVASDVAEIPSEIAKKGVSEGIRNKLEDAAGRLGLLGIAFNIGANRDFLGKPIESQGDRNLLPKDRYNQNSSKLAYWLGQAFGVSPKMTDYAGQQTLGFMWKYQKAAFPVDASRRDATLGVKNRYVKHYDITI